MAFKVDREKAKKKAAEEAAKVAARQSYGTRLYWKPKVGQNKIRVMPPWTDQGPNSYQFWREVHVHWGIGPDEDNVKHISCPWNTPPKKITECPVCDEYNRLKGSSDPEEKEAARELRPKPRAFSNIINLNDPTWTNDDVTELKANNVENPPTVGDPKIQLFSYGPKILKELLDIFQDADITDLKEGYDINITREGTGLQTEYRVRADLKPSKAPFKGEPKLTDLDGLMPFMEPYEIKAALEGIDPEEAKQLTSSTKPAETEEEEPAEAEEEEPEAEEEESEEEEPEAEEEPEDGGNGVKAAEEIDPTVEWVDDDGLFKIPDGHPECFSFERDPEDSVCNSECGAFVNCEVATEFRLALEGKKKKSKKKAMKKTTAKKQGTAAVDDLADKMRAAVKGMD